MTDVPKREREREARAAATRKLAEEELAGGGADQEAWRAEEARLRWSGAARRRDREAKEEEIGTAATGRDHRDGGGRRDGWWRPLAPVVARRQPSRRAAALQGRRRGWWSARFAVLRTTAIKFLRFPLDLEILPRVPLYRR